MKQQKQKNHFYSMTAKKLIFHSGTWQNKKLPFFFKHKHENFINDKWGTKVGSHTSYDNYNKS